MDKLVIQGGHIISGELFASGAKNSALPILFSTILFDDGCRLENIPDLADIGTTLKLLNGLGAKCVHNKNQHSVTVNAGKINSTQAPYDLVRTMRASVLVLGPLLARYGKAHVSLPGGCSIGARPVNLHLSGFEKMGAAINIEGGYINAACAKLKGARIVFDQVSVGATENLMLGAVTALGETVLRNAACEPEIVDLAHFLVKCGAKIEGAGTPVIKIQGVSRLDPAVHSVIPDRIEAGTYLTAAAITGGKVRVNGIRPNLLEAVLDKFSSCGFTVKTSNGKMKNDISRYEYDSKAWIELDATSMKRKFKSVDITTAPFPGFPTDMQAQFMALMALAAGTAVIEETVFENRFMHVPELVRLGADITVNANTAVVRGARRFSGTCLMATDLRASACLVLAALAVQGETVIRRIYHLDRGYEKMEERLTKLGALIKREDE